MSSVSVLRNLRSVSSRTANGVAAQAGCALRADRYLAAIDCASSCGSSAIVDPVAGFRTVSMLALIGSGGRQKFLQDRIARQRLAALPIEKLGVPLDGIHVRPAGPAHRFDHSVVGRRRLYCEAFGELLHTLMMDTVHACARNA